MTQLVISAAAGQGPAGIDWPEPPVAWQMGNEIFRNQGQVHRGSSYRARSTHAATADNEPGVGPGWADFWEEIAVGLSDDLVAAIVGVEGIADEITTVAEHVGDVEVAAQNIAAIVAAPGHAASAEEDAERSQAYAALAGAKAAPLSFSTVANLLADAVLVYSAMPDKVVVGSGDILGAGVFRYRAAASNAVDHHLMTAGGVKLYVLPTEYGWATAAFGIDSTGGTDVTAALQKVHAVAGEGATILYGFGAVYLISAGISTSARQRVVANGATLKRRNQIVTATTTAITANVTNQVTVADASALTVGMEVAFAQQGVARASLVYGSTLSAVRRVTAKVGNEITLNAAVNINVGVGGTCALTFTSLKLAHAAEVDGLVLDGNRGNWTWARWEVTAEIVTDAAGNDQTIRNCFVNASPGEGFTVYSDNVCIDRSRFSAVGGNPIHLSGSDGARIVFNFADDANIDTAVGHADGFVCISDAVTDTLVHGNRAKRCISGIGSFDNSNSDLTVTDNDFRDMYGSGFDLGAGAARLVFRGNRIYNCATDTSKKPGKPYYGAVVGINLSGGDYLIEGNYLDGVVVLTASGGKRLNLTGNQVTNEVLIAGWSLFGIIGNDVTGKPLRIGQGANGRVARNLINLSGDTSTLAISLYATGAYENVDVEENTVIGGAYGVSIGATATALNGVCVARNRLSGQSSRGISVDNTAAAVESLVIEDNKIGTGVNSGASVNGILIKTPNTTVQRNEVVNSTGATASRVGINVIMAAANKVVVKDNVTRGPWANDIALTANAGIFAINNVIDGAISNQTGNTVSGTVTI